MTPQAAQAAHATLMRDHVAPALHERDFTGKMAFRRTLPTGWHLLTFHGSNQPSTGKALLTIDVAAITEKAWTERQEWSAEHTPAVKLPKLPTATWADPERIGILRMGLDIWYEYLPTADLEALCTRVMKDVDRYAMPYMEKKVSSKVK